MSFGSPSKLSNLRVALESPEILGGVRSKVVLCRTVPSNFAEWLPMGTFQDFQKISNLISASLHEI